MQFILSDMNDRFKRATIHATTLLFGTAAALAVATAGAREAHASCGDGDIDLLEFCDDGNTASGDGCSSICLVELGYNCRPALTATGVDSIGLALPQQAGNYDAHWEWSLSASRTNPKPGYVARNLAWLLPLTGQWLTTEPSFGTAAPLDQAGTEDTYWFLDVYVPASVAGDVAMSIAVAADNSAQLFVNGVDLGAASSSFSLLTTTTIPASALIAGTNVIMIRVHETSPGTPRGLLVVPGSLSMLSQCTALCTSDGACDDGNECTSDDCTLLGACIHTAVADGAPCTAGACNTQAAPVCEGVCGDGETAANETCDDGGAASGDGCSATCSVEDGWTCSGTPSTCAAICGDHVLAGNETCDDGNLIEGDGCSSLCVTEESGDPPASCGDGAMPQPCPTDADGDGWADGTLVAGGGNHGCAASATHNDPWGGGGGEALIALLSGLVLFLRPARRRQHRR